MSKKVVICCGGTGGHVFPGIATANVLAGRGHDVAVILSGRDVESASSLDWRGRVLAVRCPKLRWNTPGGIVRSGAGLFMAVVNAWWQFRRFRPDVLLAMGSYTSFGPVVAARLRRIPVVLHDANAIPGAAISTLSRFAGTVAVSFDEAKRHFHANMNVVKTGLPIRTTLVARPALLPRVGGKKTILVMGGSQGARAINALAAETMGILTREEPSQWRVLHLTGRAEEEDVRRAYAALSLGAASDVTVYGFLEDMGGAYASADFCICRSGANSCFELALCGPVPIFVPLPTAIRDHQTANAKAFADCGAALLMPQGDLTARRLAQKLMELRQQDAVCGSMRERLRALAQPHAAESLASVVVP